MACWIHSLYPPVQGKILSPAASLQYRGLPLYPHQHRDTTIYTPNYSLPTKPMHPWGTKLQKPQPHT
ncbi:hypothetical protein BJX66DRAFT_291842 [Aspergillus keveii]|uniref:Uncharacterized protein n=1 Tax=Aspergillus keveii TaxID=714993 RepID=A0ABR4GMW7_9EURO